MKENQGLYRQQFEHDNCGIGAVINKAGALPTELHPRRSGIHLLSHTVSSAVPSASWVLTVVFGMGTGVSPKRIDARNIVIQL